MFLFCVIMNVTLISLNVCGMQIFSAREKGRKEYKEGQKFLKAEEYKKAFYAFQQSHELGNIEASIQIGTLLYFHTSAFPKFTKEEAQKLGFDRLKELAKRGHVKANFIVAQILMNTKNELILATYKQEGQPEGYHYQRAFEYADYAAEKNHKEALLLAVHLVAKGLVKQEHQKIGFYLRMVRVGESNQDENFELLMEVEARNLRKIASSSDTSKSNKSKSEKSKSDKSKSDRSDSYTRSDHQ